MAMLTLEANMAKIFQQRNIASVMNEPWTSRVLPGWLPF